MTLTFVYPTPLPSTKGWGPGWTPKDSTCSVIKPHIKPHPIFVGGIHERIYDLTNMLVDELKDLGFKFDTPGCWGYGCRATKTSSASQTGTPSFHSWGLAWDVNAPKNVFGADRASTQLGQPTFDWVIKLMRKWGFFWLGPSIGDWMHFSFVGSPEDADSLTALAKKEGLGMALTDEQKATLAAAKRFLDELEGDIKANGPVEAGSRVAKAVKKAEADVAPGVPAHSHTGSVTVA